MEWARLFVEFLKIIIWPIVAIVVLFKLHPNLKQLAGRLKKFKTGDHEIEFHEVPKLESGKVSEKTVLQLEKGAEPSPTEPSSKALPTGPAQEPAPGPPMLPPSPEPPAGSAAEPALIEYAPAGAIVNAWSRLEDAMRHEIERLNLNEGRPSRSGRSMVVRLAKAGVIDPETEVAALQMSALRNRVAHLHELPTTSAATQFVETAEELIGRIRNGADRLRLAELIRDLRANVAQDVAVGPLRASGAASTEEGARVQAESRMGKWAAVRGGVIMMLSQRDAALLLSNGARAVRDPEEEIRHYPRGFA
jgi:hypothetical protein